RQFNDATKNRNNEPVPVEITVYGDKSFDFKLFTAPTSYKLLQAAKLEKGSPNSKTTKIATVNLEQITEIAKYKLPDLNTDDLEAAIKIVKGTAKNMGILIKEDINTEKSGDKNA
ncbi:MAG: 50S ribosomal protein L11, partial [Mycoplasma sp.]|nr:50S ribosomal protein L11 [Mycoplasma sp.]